VNDYEKAREARVAANAARLAELNIPTLALGVAPAAPERSRGLSSKKRKADAQDAPPPRKSSRLQGAAPDPALAAGVLEERRDGSVRLQSGLVLPAEEVAAVRPAGTLPFRSSNGTEATDAQYLATLRAAPEPAEPSNVLRVGHASWALAASAVVKATPKGVTHLDWAPRQDELLLAAGDKSGCVSLFHLSEARAAAAEAAAEEDDGAADGVCAFRPHAQYISGLRWAREGATRLLTCSYDGSLRCLDAGSGSWLESFVGAEGEEWSAFDPAPHAATAYLGDNEGGVRLLDLRAGRCGGVLAAHGKRVNTVSAEREGRLLATACGDSTVALWDVRAGLSAKAAPLARLSHGKSVQAAYWAPVGAARLLTTCYDDRLRIWADTGGAWEASLAMKHDNQTGRWLLPFRAVWAPCGEAFVCGSMQRETEIVSAATGRHLAKLASPALLTAVPSRHAVAASGLAIAAATASGRVHVWRPTA